MDAKTAEALEASIAKWERNAGARTSDDVVLSYCPLCEEFLAHDAQCRGCPVFEKTRRAFCNRTPFDRAYTAANWWHEGRPSGERRFRAAARDEVEFLKSLREPVAVEDAA